MGRRSIHTPEQLRELVLRSAYGIIAEKGLSGISAREIARRIGYSPGTLYNLFDSLDDLVLQVEALLLDELDRKLAELPVASSPDEQLNRLAQAYLGFSREHPKLWNLIAQHSLPPKSTVPSWYSERLERLVGRVETALAGCIPLKSHSQALRRSALVLWSGLHGLTSAAAAEKLSSIVSSSVDILVNELVTTFLAGLREKAKTGGLSSS